MEVAELQDAKATTAQLGDPLIPKAAQGSC